MFNFYDIGNHMSFIEILNAEWYVECQKSSCPIITQDAITPFEQVEQIRSKITQKNQNAQF